MDVKLVLEPFPPGCTKGELMTIWGYLVGLLAMWVLCDGIISIRLYYNKLAETGGRKQNWLLDHSIRLIRCAIALFIMIVVAPIW